MPNIKYPYFIDEHILIQKNKRKKNALITCWKLKMEHFRVFKIKHLCGY